MTDSEKNLRALWTERGIPKARQDALIARVAAQAAPGAFEARADSIRATESRQFFPSKQQEKHP